MARQLKRNFIAYAYTSGNLTAEGKKPVAGKVIAADPRVLPMGTRVRISEAGPWSGEYRVGDVGPNILGNKIDVFVPSVLEAREFGKRRVTVTVLEFPVRTAGIRTRKAGPRTCSGCGQSRPEAMMTVDEARQSSVNTADGSVAAGAARIGSERSNSGQGRSDTAFARLPSVQRASVN